MQDIISYVKSLLYPSDISRKRRAPAEDFDILPATTKMRKTMASSPLLSSGGSIYEDCIPTTSTSFTKHRNSRHNYNSKPIWSKENSTVIDDDDDILQVLKSKHEVVKPTKSSTKIGGKTHTTSTPRKSIIVNGNSSDDVIFVGATETSSQKKMDAKKRSLEYIKPFTLLDAKPKKNTSQNGTKVKDFSTPLLNKVSEIRNKLGLDKRRLHSGALDESYRLDEKRKYQELLAQAATNCKLADSFSKYSTPTGKPFAYGSGRGKKMVEMSKNKAKPTVLIDLTKNDNSKRTTKDAIEMALRRCDEEAGIKDIDSDLEILPRPPSPKPDIKIERVNSLKRIVDSTEHSHEEWLRNQIHKHRRFVTDLEKEISTKAAEREKLKVINTEIHSRRLGDQLAKYLQIKDDVLPIIIEEAPFPELTEEDDIQIDKALNRRANLDDVLSSKFNLNITRRDMLTLAGLNWLNDEVINFYMNLLIERGKISKWPKVYAMNTFFYPKLLKDGHNSLKRWTRRVDLFAYDLIAVPIHLGVHWCMCIIDFRNNIIKYFDSMGSSNNECLESLLMYLEDEHLDKKQCTYDTSQWKLENVKNIPHQMNGSDCGMFACTFAEVITRDAKIKFSQDNMPYLRRKMVLEILNCELMIQ